MQMKNTELTYGSVAKWLHWITAVLFLLAYISVYYRHWFTEPKTPVNWTTLQLHLTFGASIGIVFVLRLIWLCVNVSPKPEPGSKIQTVAAKAGHVALYGMIALMVITGYLGTGADIEFFFLFDIPGIRNNPVFESMLHGVDFKEFEKPFDFIHKEVMGKWLTWILILGHAGAALYHHYVLKDRTLVRMTKTI